MLRGGLNIGNIRAQRWYFPVAVLGAVGFSLFYRNHSHAAFPRTMSSSSTSSPGENSDGVGFIASEQDLSKNVRKFRIKTSGRDLSCREVVDLWQTDDHFVRFFNKILQDAPYPAYFWETPPFRFDRLNHTFEFIIAEASTLARVRADPSPFHQFLAPHCNTNNVVTFPNLGKDAILIAPCPNGDLDAYPHLANFVRCASDGQVVKFWRAVGKALDEKLKGEVDPVWVSTSGLGVYWLHVRLDSYPKYYTHRPYRTPDFTALQC